MNANVTTYIDGPAAPYMCMVMILPIITTIRTEFKSLCHKPPPVSTLDCFIQIHLIFIPLMLTFILFLLSSVYQSKRCSKVSAPAFCSQNDYVIVGLYVGGLFKIISFSR